MNTTSMVKRINPILIFALILVLLVGTFAFFTDRVEGSASVTTAAGIDITTDPDDPTYEDDLDGKWAAVNAGPFSIFNPGDQADLSFVISNEGDLAVDIRETFILTSNVALKDGAPEFRLYSATTKDDYGAVNGGTVLVKEEKINDKTYKYTIESYVLSSESETIGANPTEKTRSYYLVFSPAAGNSFQDATCTVNYVAEAKQYSTGGNSDWATAATATINLGGQTLTVVPSIS